MDSRYPPSLYNIYPFHFSDGDNMTSDNERCVRMIKEMLTRANIFGYGEVNQYNRGTSLQRLFGQLWPI